MTTNTTIPTTNTATTITSTDYPIINRISVTGTNYAIGMSEDIFAEAMEKYMQKREPVFYKLTCQGCGASLNQRINDYIVKCPYCRSAYAIGTKMVYSK